MGRLLILMFAAFVAQTTEYLPIGLRPAIRMVTALPHGVFRSILAPLATRLAPDSPGNRATAVALAVISLAMVLGVLAANGIGQWLGWRAAFAVFAAPANHRDRSAARPAL